MHRIRARVLLSLLLPVTVACGPGSAGDQGDDDIGEWEDGRTLIMAWTPPQRPRVDMIMVVDDSPSMRAHQATLAANAGIFAELLAAEEVEADTRVVITTTSVPGPTCAGPRARGGEPLLDSCLAHLEDFVGLDEHGEYGGGNEDFSELCQSHCDLASIDRVASRGFEDDPTLALRPWIEPPLNSFGGNLGADVPFEQALGCGLMQGFSGCRFESPIEAAARVVERAQDPADPLYGFRRDEATLLVTIFSDEDDCSHPDSSAPIFDPDGARVFWPEGADQPLSAICVNAGLACDAEGCALVDHDLSGQPTSDPAQAVLTSPQRLVEALAAAGEYERDPWVPAVAVVGGFTAAGNVDYQQPEPGSEYEGYAALFGVGPGCTAPGPALAAPAGRLQALTEATTPGNDFSICNADWSPVLSGVADSIKIQLQPVCMDEACYADQDPQSALLEPDCVLERIDGEDLTISVPACERDAEGWVIDEQSNDYQIPAGEEQCWIWLTDSAELSADPADDMDPECADEGAPGQVKITRRPGAGYPPHGYSWRLRCRPC